MNTNQLFSYLFTVFLFVSLPLCGRGQAPRTEKDTTPKKWIAGNTIDTISGIGIARYSSYNPEKAWQKALENSINDLNANLSMLVYYWGKQIGRGPFRTRSKYAIRNLLDSTQVTVIDSARWKGHAFVLIKPKEVVPDSIIYTDNKLNRLKETRKDTAVSQESGQHWLTTTGSTPKIDSNWFMSITKAKQDALRRLARKLSVKITTETYSKGDTQRRYFNFSTIFAFQRIRVLNRSFNSDSVKVTVAVHPHEIKWLMK
ncbi:hypothetical protein [Fodinibius halophilus]|uniref:Uncharacterized protein n=1 Tax=Fodinibius halophilus TaxID=1736908 RepID=A0A6M1T694_9BACT|nr:hypothetical protein [Fodinibius halophilus]NGP87531.1 hypothetical protein [Fodinibius halophilus]